MSIESARILNGRYQLHATLGRGGMATVWAGVDTRLDRPVAIKILDRSDPIMLQRLDHEARIVARLAHPNLVAVYDVGSDGGDAYLVMELVEGENLQRHLANGPLPVTDVTQIASQICAALEAAHDAGIVHRDIKPANIMLTPTATVKVCDFGIARIQQVAQVTGQATAVGTSEYMAPEQATGAAVDARTDLYALGCVIYSMLTGAPPFTGDNPVRVLWQHVNQPPPPMRTMRTDVPAELDELVQQLLAKNAADRPPTARSVRDRLARLPLQSWPPAGAAPPRAPAHARAAVVTRTRTMPAIPAPADRPLPRGFRLGPAGIAAVAIGAAAVAAIVVALAAASQSTPDTSPTGGATVTITASPSPAPTANAPLTVEDFRAAVLDQVRAGQLDAGAANDLTDKLDDIDKALADGKSAKAADKADDLRKKLAELNREGNLNDAGYATLLAGLDQLSGGLPTDRDGGGED